MSPEAPDPWAVLDAAVRDYLSNFEISDEIFDDAKDRIMEVVEDITQEIEANA